MNSLSGIPFLENGRAWILVLSVFQTAQAPFVSELSHRNVFLLCTSTDATGSRTNLSMRIQAHLLSFLRKPTSTYKENRKESETIFDLLSPEKQMQHALIIRTQMGGLNMVRAVMKICLSQVVALCCVTNGAIK